MKKEALQRFAESGLMQGHGDFFIDELLERPPGDFQVHQKGRWQLSEGWHRGSRNIHLWAINTSLSVP